MPAVNMIIENATLLNTAGKYCDKDIVVVPVVQPDNVRVTLEITLKATEWVDNKQLVESATITEDSTLVVSHTMADVQAYLDSGIMLASAEVGKMEFTCVVVPTEDIKVLVHIVDPLITAGGAEPILSFDSVEEMNAYEAEDGAIAIVPSEGGDESEFEVVELTTTLVTNGNTYITKEESTVLNSAWEKGNPIIIKGNLSVDHATPSMYVENFSTVAMRGSMQGMKVFAFTFGSFMLIITDVGGSSTWTTERL